MADPVNQSTTSCVTELQQMYHISIWCVLISLALYACCYGYNSFPRVITGRQLCKSTSRNLFGRSDPAKNPIDNKNGGGIFGGMGDMFGALKKAQELAKKAEQLNKELSSSHFIGKDTSGTVTATFDGTAKPVSVAVPDSMLAQGSDAVSLAVTQAVLDGHTKSQAAMMGRMQDLYSQLGVPTPPSE